MTTSTTTMTPTAAVESPWSKAAALAALDGEPRWLTSARAQAWQEFLRLPVPARTEERWRFGSVERLAQVDGYQAPAASAQSPAALSAMTVSSALLAEGPVAGRLVFGDDQLLLWTEAAPELQARGVIFCPLATAISSHPELVRQHFLARRADLGSHKYEALHTALFRSGVFLHVPRGVEIEAPFVVHHWNLRSGGAVFPHTLAVLAPLAKATLLEFFHSAEGQAEGLAIGTSTLLAQDGAHLAYKAIQNWSLGTLAFHLQTNTAARDAHLRTMMVNLGGQYVRHESHTRIVGAGANVDMFSLGVASGTQEFDQRTLQTHSAPASRSDLLFKNALLDESRTVFSGLIRVDELAQQTDAYQTNRNLVLSDVAEANSLPGLEILANDVKCSHGATTGRLDPAELFYLRARGIPQRTAQQLLVFGFFEEVVEKFHNPALSTWVRDAVHEKFHDLA